MLNHFIEILIGESNQLIKKISILNQNWILKNVYEWICMSKNINIKKHIKWSLKKYGSEFITIVSAATQITLKKSIIK